MTLEDKIKKTVKTSETTKEGKLLNREKRHIHKKNNNNRLSKDISERREIQKVPKQSQEI